MEIVKCVELNDEVWQLLRLADPSDEVILNYINKSHVFIAKDECVLGVFVLFAHNHELMELMNIAVHPNYQHKGIGKKILNHAISFSKQAGFKELKVATGNSSIYQLAFYQKAGFRMSAIIKDYFIKHYDEPIYEDGIQCIDQIILIKKI